MKKKKNRVLCVHTYNTKKTSPGDSNSSASLFFLHFAFPKKDFIVEIESKKRSISSFSLLVRFFFFLSFHHRSILSWVILMIIEEKLISLRLTKRIQSIEKSYLKGP
jgi:hypothetical protein